jgi:twitching motility protein PilT
MYKLHDLLQVMIERNASDLHLTAGVPPQIRIDGLLHAVEEVGLAPEDTEKLIYSVMREDQRKKFEMERELDFSFGIRGLARFRANVYSQRGVTTTAIRQIPYKITALRDIGVPKPVHDFAELPNGLVLVTGPTGSGKSTTLAAIIDQINTDRSAHIMTIEDPIEYVHQHKKSIVNQREVGADTGSFATALKYVLRQDPDVILIGEMRDRETMQAALTIAETGHLVFATLHTNSTFESISRIVDVFPSDQHEMILTQLAFVLRGVCTQKLLPKKSGMGRVLVAEVLLATAGIRALIRENKTHQIYSMMQAGQKHGMQTMNMALCDAVLGKKVAADMAYEHSSDPKELESMLNRSGFTMARKRAA